MSLAREAAIISLSPLTLILAFTFFCGVSQQEQLLALQAIQSGTESPAGITFQFLHLHNLSGLATFKVIFWSGPLF